MPEEVKKTKAEKSMEMDLAENKVHEFKDKDRTIFAVAEEENTPPILGISGFGMAVIYDEKKLKTMEQLTAAANALANEIVQFVLDKTVADEE